MPRLTPEQVYARDKEIVEHWRQGDFTHEELSRQLGCPLSRIMDAINRMRVPLAERKERATRLKDLRVARLRAQRDAWVDQEIGPLYEQGMSLQAMRTALHIDTKTLAQALARIGVDWESLRNIRAPARSKKKDPCAPAPAKCPRCEIFLHGVSAPGVGRIPRAFDDLCFVCWYERKTGRLFTVSQPLSKQELRVMAAGFKSAAIETEYKGVLFPARTMARWAVFLDECDVAWEYKPEGFWLEDYEAWLVVRSYADEQDQQEARALAKEKGAMVWLFSGVPAASKDMADNEPPGYEVPPEGMIMPIAWKQCLDCDEFSVVPIMRFVCPICESHHSLSEHGGTLRRARNIARKIVL